MYWSLRLFNCLWLLLNRTHLVSWNRFCSHWICVCSPPRALITSGMIWCDIGHMWLVKPILQLFSILPSINLANIQTMKLQQVMHARQRCRSWRHTSHRRRCINYLAVAARQSALIIKLSGWMRSDELKRRLDFNFTVIILAWNNFLLK